MYKRQYCRGSVYTSIEEFLADYRDCHGVRYCYYNHKVMHINFVAAMRLSSIICAIDKGILYHAVKSNNSKETGVTNG